MATVLSLGCAACGSGDRETPSEAEDHAPVTNRIAVPPEVVSNLGITFEKARSGHLEVRVAIPGFLEAPDHRRFTLRAPAAGLLALHKVQWDDVGQGELVAELRSVEVTRLQRDLHEARRALLSAESELALLEAESRPLATLAETVSRSADAAQRRLEPARQLAKQSRLHAEAAHRRLTTLEDLAAETQVSEQERLAARKDAVEAGRAALDAEQAHEDLALRVDELRVRAATAGAEVDNLIRRREIAEQARSNAEAALRQQLEILSSLTGMSDDAVDTPLDRLTVHSPTAGLVATLLASDGEWVEEGQPLVEVVDPTELLFTGDVPEADLAQLGAGASVRVEAASGEIFDSVLRPPLPVADPTTRTVRVLAPVSNGEAGLPIGLSATAMVLVERGEFEEVLVPSRCLVQDGLEWICFRKDAADPGTVIRTPVSLGRRSAGWAEVLAGVGAGEELVADGIHQLKETGIGRASLKGHFHADGTFHAGDE